MNNVLLLLIGLLAQGDFALAPRPLSVSYEVDCTNSSTEAVVSSYVNRELADLNAVQIKPLSKANNYHLMVVVMEAKMVGKLDDVIGYSVFVILTRPFEATQNVINHLTAESEDLKQELIASVEHELITYYLRMLDDDALQPTINQLIAEINRDYFQPARQLPPSEPSPTSSGSVLIEKIKALQRESLEVQKLGAQELKERQETKQEGK